MVGKCVSKENPKSDLDLGLRVCQFNNITSAMFNAYLISTLKYEVNRQLFGERIVQVVDKR